VNDYDLFEGDLLGETDIPSDDDSIIDSREDAEDANDDDDSGMFVAQLRLAHPPLLIGVQWCMYTDLIGDTDSDPEERARKEQDKENKAGKPPRDNDNDDKDDKEGDDDKNNDDEVDLPFGVQGLHIGTLPYGEHAYDVMDNGVAQEGYAMPRSRIQTDEEVVNPYDTAPSSSSSIFAYFRFILLDSFSDSMISRDQSSVTYYLTLEDPSGYAVFLYWIY
jgi:hypothetical protein